MFAVKISAFTKNYYRHTCSFPYRYLGKCNMFFFTFVTVEKGCLLVLYTCLPISLHFVFPCKPWVGTFPAMCRGESRKQMPCSEHTTGVLYSLHPPRKINQHILISHSVENLKNTLVTRTNQHIWCLLQPESEEKWSRRQHNYVHVGFNPRFQI